MSTTRDNEPTLTLTQISALLGAIDLERIRDSDGNVDTVKLAGIVNGYTPPPTRRGPTATGHQLGTATQSGGRHMFNERHRKPGYDQ
jgi:hypothetical protein